MLVVGYLTEYRVGREQRGESRVVEIGDRRAWTYSRTKTRSNLAFEKF